MRVGLLTRRTAAKESCPHYFLPVSRDNTTASASVAVVTASVARKVEGRGRDLEARGASKAFSLWPSQAVVARPGKAVSRSM